MDAPALNGASSTRTISQVKPIDASDVVEQEPAVTTAAIKAKDNDIQQRLVLRPWRVRFWDQFTALSYKQLLVYTRNGRSTALRLLAPLFFMFILWLLNVAIQSYGAFIDVFIDVPNPDIDIVSGIPACNTDVYLNPSGCFDFAYSPNTSAVANAIAEGMRLNNPGRVISTDSVLSFASITDANTYMLANPEVVQGAIHFLLDADSVGEPLPSLNYVLRVNSTSKYFRATFEDPSLFSALPIQVNAEREMARYQWVTAGKGPPESLAWNVSVSQYAHPNVGDVNIVGQAMGPFIFAANMFNFVLLLSGVVAERERGLRQALKTAGMLDSAFWLSWALVEVVISVFFTLFTIAFGAMFQFSFFLHNSFALVFLLFLLFQWAMVGVAFILSTFLTKTSTAINLGFVIFILGWILQVAITFGYPYTPDNYKSAFFVTVIFTLLPFAPLSKGAIDLGMASEDTGDGILWGRRNLYCQNIKNPDQQDALFATDPSQYWDFSCVFPLGNILAILAIEAGLYFLIAVYLNNVLPDENGVRKKMWYPFTLEYWWGGGRYRAGKRRSLRPPVPVPAEFMVAHAPGEGDADVAAEEEEMKELLQHRTAGGGSPLASTADVTNAAEVFGLQKAFGRRGWLRKSCYLCCCDCCRAGGCCRLSRKKNNNNNNSNSTKRGEFWAIKGTWLAIERDRMFCLLGPNGAGKTTTINCLTGVLPPTGGDALVYGESITSTGGMDRIRAVMGVCPQFDVLWGELTGSEHLYIYGRVKGLPVRQVTAQSAELLDAVKLTSASLQRTSTYSGGMRRRLSVAIALLGDPLLVYLDEPTTGMDPISRRQVWDVIEGAKSGRAIVLTTHSMEEADILGDSIAIMARGRVRAYGSSLRLKQKFGSGYQLSVAVVGSSVGGSSEKGGAVAATTHANEEETAALKASRVAVVEGLFKEHLGVAGPEDAGGAYIVFLVPKDAEDKLPSFLKMLEGKRKDLGITDIQISLTSLEEVFLSIAKRAELEAAVAEGRSVVEVRLEDGSILEVELGAEEATQESTGRRYAVKWAQDEQGSLSVMSWTLLSGGGDNGNGAAVVEPPVLQDMPTTNSNFNPIPVVV